MKIVMGELVRAGDDMDALEIDVSVARGWCL